MQATDKQRYLRYLNDVLKNMRVLLIYENKTVKEIDYIEQLAIERAFEIIGEATKRLSVSSFYEKYPDVEWSNMAKTRDFVIHHYDDTELVVLLRIIKQDLRRNINLIEKILEAENGSK